MTTRPFALPFADFAPQIRGLPLTALLALWRQRRTLATLDAARLDDIGVTEAEAMAEAARPIWDVPAHWRA
jgi:uncharacterized protein YjiS (DUF1127 family)